MVTDHEHILQRKVRTEIMLRTSSRFDLKKNPEKKKGHRLIDSGYQQNPGFPKRRDTRSAEKSRRVRGRGTKHECSERTRTKEKGVGREEGKGEERGKGRQTRGGGREKGRAGGSIIFQ